ncbi:flippase-like domain-containing protein [Aggregicoccus sp. 17bor-14]|uniref:lysylphosphatidylglycerol synthase transmembrane domain-containing protein n=1 Tax=Myxococcaceae TaxID=31 RepID=UPI0012F301BB|nr:flippase-like domain-containing protein [Simulacricoccus sp. 17bor-14]MRI89961.1 flippase-like domain-containing protein [Aggregicoccus sp. 17bor-14]
MKRAAKLLLSVAVTVAFSWWAFRETDWHAQFASLRNANYLWLLPYVGILLLIHLARTLRWGCLLSGMERVPFGPLNAASGIGFMMLLVLPFRLGEFARPFLIAQRSSIRRSAAMTTVVLERITDGIFVALMLRSLLFFVPTETPEVRYVKLGANLMFAVFGGGLVFLLFALWHQASAVRLVRTTLGRLSPAGAEKVAGVVDSFVGAMRQLPRAGQLVAFFALTVLYWALNGVGMAVLARAFDCSAAAPGGVCQPLQLDLFQAFVVLAVLVVGLMIPAAPGMMGTFQAAIKVGLGLFLPAAVVNGTGLAYANVMWLAQTAQQVLLGLLLMSVGQMSFRDLAGKLGKDEGGEQAGAA